MASAISSAARLLTAITDTVRVVESCEKMFQAQEAGRDPLLDQASVVNRLISLGFTIAEAAMVISGSKNEALLTLKKIEVLPRVLDLPISVFLEASKADGSWRSVVRVWERGVVAPLADIIRVGAEGQAYCERQYLEMSPEEVAKARRPVYEVETTGQDVVVKFVGHGPVDLEECRKNLAQLERSSFLAASTRYACESEVFETLVSGIPFHERLLRYFQGPPLRVPPAAAAAAAAAAAGAGAVPAAPHPVDRLAAFLAIDFQQYPRIPDPLHDDEVFRQFICPITGEPIRDPVRDPTDKRTLYERSAIANWLSVNHTSPMTRGRLAMAQLIEVPGIRAVIDRRLAHHREGLAAYLRDHLNDPIPPADREVIAETA